MMPALDNPQHEIFAQEYSRHGHSQRAVIAAKFNVKTWVEHGSTSAAATGSRLLKDVKILQRIQELQEQRARRADVSEQYVLTKLKTIVHRCLQEVRPVLDKTGQPTGEFEFDSMGANKSLELIGKHLRMWADDKHAAAVTNNTQINFYIPTNGYSAMENARDGHPSLRSAGTGSSSAAIGGQAPGAHQPTLTLPDNGHHNGSH